MKILRDIYGYEALFLTRRGLELGDEKWIKKNVINLLDPPTDVYSKILALFRRVAKKTISTREIPAKISIRALKRRVTIEIVAHPLLDRLKTGSLPLLSNGRYGWDALRNNFYGIVSPVGNSYRGPSGVPFPIFRSLPHSRFVEPVSYSVSVFKFTYQTKIIVLPSGRYTHTMDSYLTNVSGSAKIFTGDICFAKILMHVEAFLDKLDVILAEVNSMFGDDILKISSTMDTEFHMVELSNIYTGCDGLLEAARQVSLI